MLLGIQIDGFLRKPIELLKKETEVNTFRVNTLQLILKKTKNVKAVVAPVVASSRRD